MEQAYDNISFVLTSCGRFDLLQKTVSSMEPWIFKFPQKLLIEDSGQHHQILDYLSQNGFLILLNKTKQGQLRSIDKAYSYVKYPYIFHCEDDWLFTEPPDLQIAKHVLKLNPRVSLVSFRKPETLPSYRIRLNDFTTIHYNGNTLLYPPFDLRNKWKFFSFTFNPHLLSKSFVDTIYPYTQYFKEGLIAYLLQKRGYSLVFQSPGNCVHLGGEKRHIPDPYTQRTLLKFWVFMKLWIYFKFKALYQ